VTWVGIPEKTRRAVLVRSRSHCEDCGGANWECGGELEFHHVRYGYTDHAGSGWFDIRGRETPDDILHLCRSCHLNKHLVGDEFYSDPEEAEGERNYKEHMEGR